jgi:hypothetical protein
VNRQYQILYLIMPTIFYNPMSPPAKPKKKRQPVPVTGDTLSALVQNIKLVESERDEFKAELRVRAQQISDLNKMCMALRIVLVRLSKGAFTQDDHVAVAPPPIFAVKTGGTVDGFEYARTSLSMMRPAVVSIHNEKMSATNDLNTLSRAVQQVSLTSTSSEEQSLGSGLEFDTAIGMLAGITEESFSDDDTDDSPEEVVL